MIAQTMRSAALISTLALLLLATGCATTPCCGPSARDGVFVHIKSGPEDAHSVLMGLRMAQVMSEDRDVAVYIDVDGIKAVVKDAPDMKMEPFGSSHAMIQDLIDREVTVYACPGCLKALDKTPDQLLPGIKVAEKEGFFAFTRGRILTIDY